MFKGKSIEQQVVFKDCQKYRFEINTEINTSVVCKKHANDKCRFKWWGKHRDLISHKNQSIKQCPHCGELFETERKTQVFCCRNCYLSEVTKR